MINNICRFLSLDALLRVVWWRECGPLLGTRYVCLYVCISACLFTQDLIISPLLHLSSSSLSRLDLRFLRLSSCFLWYDNHVMRSNAIYLHTTSPSLYRIICRPYSLNDHHFYQSLLPFSILHLVSLGIPDIVSLFFLFYIFFLTYLYSYNRLACEWVMELEMNSMALASTLWLQGI